MSFGIPVRNGVMLGLTASTALTTRGGFPVPALSLNFLSGTLDSRITFTRALNTATRVNSSGFIETVNANIPRFDYDPVTLQPRGLLIEETRTNVLTYSQDWSNAAWVKNNVLLATETILAPDGLVSVDKIIANTVNIAKFTAQTGLTSTTGTFSVYVKPAGETVISLWLVNATVGASFTLTGSGSTALLGATASTITPVANGWYRCTVYHTVASTTAHIYLRNGSSFVGDGVSGVYLRAAQFEAGAFATSYIPTVASTVTRNADVATMTGANFSSWYNAVQGTFIADVTTLFSGVAPAAAFVLGFDNSASKRILYWGTGADQISTFDGTTVLAAIGDTTGVAVKAASAYSVSGRAITANAGAVQTGTIAAGYSTASLMSIGNNAGVSLANSHIRSITYFNIRLPNDRLQALTR